VVARVKLPAGKLTRVAPVAGSQPVQGLYVRLVNLDSTHTVEVFSDESQTLGQGYPVPPKGEWWSPIGGEETVLCAPESGEPTVAVTAFRSSAF
jgi:hypothetical protein